MGHNLDITNGVASFASANELAWHALGEVVEGAMTAEQAMKKARLGGWDVRKLPLLAATETGEALPIEGRYAIARNNPVVKGQVDILGVGQTESYHEIQNEEHADLLNAVVDESGAHFQTAGALDGGRKVFLTMKLPGHIRIGRVDPIENYLAAVNSHDGSMAFTFMVTPVRVVCQNTLNLAFGEASHVFRVRHTSGAQKALVQQAREVLEVTFNYLDEFQEQAERLINTTMTQSRFEEIISGAFGAPEGASVATVTRCRNKVDAMAELFSDAFTQDGVRETAWAGLNAMTEWFDHQSPTRGDDRDNARAMKAIFDPSFKNRALELMLAG